MIIRKPYAFLIKNFKKIHAFLFVLSLFVAYKLLDVNGFVSDFMRFGTYDLYQNPVQNHISSWLLIIVVLLIIGSLSLVFLLRYKQKPWKLYLLPVIEYTAMFFVLNIIRGFFRNYTDDVATTDLRMARDLLAIFLVVQLPAMAIFLVRGLGLDINKFHFNADKEYLELSEEDREEVEIGFSIDKNSFIRIYRRFLRNSRYFYLEHTKGCKALFIVIIALLCYNIYKSVFITNRSYSEGELYSANGYTMKVNNAYFTDKDYAGNIISSKSNFVIIDITIQNNSSPRKINLGNFHLKNGTKDYTTTQKVYEKEFSDMGTTYDSVKEVKRDEIVHFIIVYKADSSLKKEKFVLYYQEDLGSLRKIKLKLKDLRVLEDAIVLNFGDYMEFNIQNSQESISFDRYQVLDEADYLVRNCISTGCDVVNRKLATDGSYKILQIDFGSDVYGAKNLIDFLKSYGKIIYKDSSGSEDELGVIDLINRSYFGKTIYLKVPNYIKEEDLLRMEFTIRNKRYIYNFY